MVVLHDTKIQIWKQFTTDKESLTSVVELYYTIQRYKFESNSQRLTSCSPLRMRCITRYKDTNLKAIHNSQELQRTSAKLYYTIQRYKFESNSQPTAPYISLNDVVLHDTKIQIWKQFTTTRSQVRRRPRLYYTIQRYKFESNSQPL